MGKPKDTEAAKVSENYNWGSFGSADANGVNLGTQSQSNLDTTQSGVGQYLNELINPSYSSESFQARQNLLDQSNNAYARQLASQAMARGARGSATQNILASIAANRNNDLRNAMTQEDSRVSNILNQLQNTENNYFNQSNTMANNILQRVSANADRQQQVNIANTAAQNQWKNNLISGATSLGGAALGGWLGGSGGAAM